ncbi:hypothetical protein AAG906_029958 [Vitis piasezkii]
MGSNLNFKNFGGSQQGDGSGRPPGNMPLVRQGSIYSLTFDEFQSTMGGIGKDFGSMNMDELLKNIWSAEEAQTMAAVAAATAPPISVQEGVVAGGYLQRQGSLTLPRTLSQKTVDEVWKDMSKEYGGGAKDGSGAGGSNLPQRQPTLGEMTLEEFLVRAGVVREDTQLAGKPNNGGFFGDLANLGNGNGLGIAFQQMGQNTGLMGNPRITESNNQISTQSPILPLNVNGVRSTQQQPQQLQQLQQLQQRSSQQQLFPKQAPVTYTTPVSVQSNGQLCNPGIRNGMVGISDSGINGNLVQSSVLHGGGMGMVGLGAGGATIASGSPANQSSDGIGKSNGDTSSVSPVPYAFNGGIRGRKCSGAVEKVIERRQRRMIKNRESAARSRARKQAYTMELEAEVAKLKEKNEELEKKQAEMMEMQKNQVMEMMNLQREVKKRCLRRTLTGPW